MSNEPNNPDPKTLPGLSQPIKKGDAGFNPLTGGEPTEKDKLHKQPRAYLKTSAQLVGKTTNEATLFSISGADVMPETRGMKEVISKNTAILGTYLFQLWQKSGGDELEIDNLNPIAEMMGVKNHEIKVYLLHLGGYTHPIIDKGKDGGLNLTIEQLFHVTFRYSSKVSAKYKGKEVPTFGTKTLSFIKDEHLEGITIRPNPLFIKALNGGGLGNVLVPDDKFIKLGLSLSDIAFKILCYTASNKPICKISEENLVKALGLMKQIKVQGTPRIRQTILKGLKELQDKLHIKSFSFDESEKMYSFIYSSIFIKHTEFIQKEEAK